MSEQLECDACGRPDGCEGVAVTRDSPYGIFCEGDCLVHVDHPQQRRLLDLTPAVLDDLAERLTAAEAERDAAYEVSTKIYAKGRAEERAAVVAWLHRYHGNTCWDGSEFANRLERGEHLTDHAGVGR